MLSVQDNHPPMTCRGFVKGLEWSKKPQSLCLQLSGWCKLPLGEGQRDGMPFPSPLWKMGDKQCMLHRSQTLDAALLHSDILQCHLALLDGMDYFN